VRDSFQKTAPRKTAEHAVKHRDGGVGSVVANHRGGRRAGEGRRYHRQLICRAFTFTQGSNDTAEVRDSFQETAPRKTAEHAIKHRDGGVGSVVANHRGGGESSMVATTLFATSLACRDLDL